MRQTSALNDLDDGDLALSSLAGVWRTSKCLHFFLHLFHRSEAANEKIKAIRQRAGIVAQQVLTCVRGFCGGFFLPFLFPQKNLQKAVVCVKNNDEELALWTAAGLLLPLIFF